MRKPLTAEDFRLGEFVDELGEISSMSMAVELIVRDETELDAVEMDALTVLVMLVNNRMSELLSKMMNKDVEVEAA